MRVRATILVIAVLVVCVPPVAARSALEPNDPGYVQQWGLQKMRVPAAWATSRGNGVVVAVVDTGVDSSHPDLRGRVLAGHDFVDDDADASDGKGHGTHVAGTIAAVAGNGLGIASIAPGAKILPVRVLGANGLGDPGDVAEGIRWAAGHGAKVINLSLAQDDELPSGGENLLRDTRVDSAIREAARRGSVVVVAAGNDDKGGRDKTAYDALVPGVIVVGAVARADARAAYSNYGEGLDVVAPGGGSVTDPGSCTQSQWIVSTWWNPQTRGPDYGGGCGTSMAVAHVSGVAALLMARGYSAAGAVLRMTSTATDVGPRGRDPQHGAGRVDALSAVGAPGAIKPRPGTGQSAQGGIGTANPTDSISGRPASGRPEPRANPLAAGRGAFRLPDERPWLIALAMMMIVAVVGAHVRSAKAFFGRR